MDASDNVRELDAWRQRVLDADLRRRSFAQQRWYDCFHATLDLVDEYDEQYIEDVTFTTTLSSFELHEAIKSADFAYENSLLRSRRVWR